MQCDQKRMYHGNSRYAFMGLYIKCSSKVSGFSMKSCHFTKQLTASDVQLY